MSVLSTSTRNFPNRLGKGANVYPSTAELSAITGYRRKNTNGRCTYMGKMRMLDKNVYRYMNFSHYGGI